MDEDAFLCPLPGVGGESRCVDATLMSAAAVGSGVGVALGVQPLSRLHVLSLSPWSLRRGGDDNGGADAGLARALSRMLLVAAGVAAVAVGEEERL